MLCYAITMHSTASPSGCLMCLEWSPMMPLSTHFSPLSLSAAMEPCP